MITTKIQLKAGAGVGQVPPKPTIVLEYLTATPLESEQILEALADYALNSTPLVLTRTIDTTTGKTTIEIAPQGL
jgi:hypothetical protein